MIPILLYYLIMFGNNEISGPVPEWLEVWVSLITGFVILLTVIICVDLAKDLRRR